MAGEDPGRFEEICRQRGLRLTTQRRAVLEVLAGRHDHPTADQVYEEVSEKVQAIARTTVYRVLEMLVQVGAARIVCHPGEAVRYEARTSQHHHLVCLGCKRMTDIELPELNDLPLPNTRKHGFVVDEYSIQFRGLCKDCREKVKKAKT